LPGDLKLLYPESEQTIKSKVPADKMFKGLNFIVTGLVYEKIEDSKQFSVTIKKFITTHGGKVVDGPRPRKKVRANSSQSLPSMILISSKETRTLKYVHALACRIPCIHYNWILHCVEQKGLIPPSQYLLPAGYSIEADEMVPISKHFLDTHIEESELPLYEHRIEVIGNPEFKSNWTEILRAAGAKVVDRLFTSNEGRIDFILSDPEPSKFMIRKAKELKKALCSTDWVIQCIINNRFINPSSNDAFLI